MKKLNRRSFINLLGASVLGSTIAPSFVFSSPKESDNVVSGETIHLTISKEIINITGEEVEATLVNGSLPAPTIRLKEGQDVTIKVTNKLDEPTSIHWHGLILPSAMDGVPNVSEGFEGIAPNETFTYKFTVKQSGTYWYHSHSGYQEQTGIYGAIIIDPIKKAPYSYDKEYLILLSDWSDESPERIYAKLKKLSHYYNMSERTHSDNMKDIKDKGLMGMFDDRQMWNDMRMSDRDLSDVTGHTYTYLMNGRGPSKEAWRGIFKQGEKIRLRFVNASAMSFFDIRIPGLKLRVVNADGNDVKPVVVDEFRIGVAETYDVIVTPRQKTHTIFAQDISRSGYALGYLSTNHTHKSDIPKMDAVQSLTHGDMGMGGSSEGMGDMKMSGGHHNHGGGGGISHFSTEDGPQTDMQAMTPNESLSDVGVGLRNNGRRVLTYADLRNIHSTKKYPPVNREISMHLTGNMYRYMWSINGISYEDSKPIKLRFGEVVRLTFTNDTMMNHPMHLHGMWSYLEVDDNSNMPRKHTIIVQPGSKISYLVTVDARAGWVLHCHMLYHMGGMFREVKVI